METIFRSILLMQKKSTNGLHKRLRLSTKYALQRSVTLKGIPTIDSHKLRSYKLRLHKLRLHKLRLHKLRLHKLRLHKLRLHKLRPRKLRLT